MDIKKGFWYPQAFLLVFWYPQIDLLIFGTVLTLICVYRRLIVRQANVNANSIAKSFKKSHVLL
ncbi:MAG: hypothetical protein LBP59_11660 [Planctomycetaceae bacterium]|nr:hypothetical protein [Planctomycetaceae bacterium]